MRRMRPAMIAELFQFQPLRRRLFIFCRRIIAVLALGTFKRNNVPH
jgi:hypothetical protein